MHHNMVLHNTTARKAGRHCHNSSTQQHTPQQHTTQSWTAQNTAVQNTAVQNTITHKATKYTKQHTTTSMFTGIVYLSEIIIQNLWHMKVVFIHMQDWNSECLTHHVSCCWQINADILTRGSSAETQNCFVLKVLWCAVIVAVHYLAWKSLQPWYFGNQWHSVMSEMQTVHQHSAIVHTIRIWYIHIYIHTHTQI